MQATVNFPSTQEHLFTSLFLFSFSHFGLDVYASVHPGVQVEQQKRPSTEMHASAHLWTDVPTSNQSAQTCQVFPNVLLQLSVSNKKINHI